MRSDRTAIVAAAGCDCCGEEGEPLRMVCPACFRELVALAEQRDRKLPTFLSVAEAARSLGVRQRTVREWIRRGDLPAVKIAAASPNGTRYRIRRSALARFVADRATTTHAH